MGVFLTFVATQCVDGAVVDVACYPACDGGVSQGMETVVICLDANLFQVVGEAAREVFSGSVVVG